MGNTLNKLQVASSMECLYQIEAYGWCQTKLNYPGIEVYDADSEAVQVVPLLCEINTSTILSRRQYWESEIAQEELLQLELEYHTCEGAQSCSEEEKQQHSTTLPAEVQENGLLSLTA